ncbi:MAG: pantetheine-phosphate adenylyltransferase [Fibrobacterales bacterium]
MKRSMTIIPGSFDPITLGHCNIIERTVELFDSVTILIGINGDKKGLYPIEQRVAMIESVTATLPNVTVDTWEGLTVEYLKKNSIRTIVRGIRNSIDFEFENQLAQVNKKLYPECETVLLASDPNLSAISSSIIRDLLKNGHTIAEFVPSEIIPFL